MIIEELLNSGIVKDDTEIFITRPGDIRPFTNGNWYEDNILKHAEREIEIFIWHGDGINVYIKSVKAAKDEA